MAVDVNLNWPSLRQLIRDRRLRRNTDPRDGQVGLGGNITSASTDNVLKQINRVVWQIVGSRALDEIDGALLYCP